MFTRGMYNLSLVPLQKTLLMSETCKIIGGQSVIFNQLYSVSKKTFIGVQEIKSQRNFQKIFIKAQNVFPFCIYLGNRLPFSTKPLNVGQSSTTTTTSGLREKEEVLKWIDFCRFEGEDIPNKITEEQFDLLLSQNKTYNAKKKYLRYLFVKEKAVEQSKIRKTKMKENLNKKKEKLKEEYKGHIKYGLWNNTMFAKTPEKTIMHVQNYKLTRAMEHGQPLVIDCGYDHHMSLKESKSLATQLYHFISLNRCNQDPFNIYLCNYDTNTFSFNFLKKHMPNIVLPEFPINITSKSYHDLFPKEKLIYLTPNSRTEMTHFDSEAVYIIGGIVDLGPKGPLTQAKAKMEGVKMMKLPLDKYHIFKASKTLGIHVVGGMLLELQESGDWQKAMRFIPKRLVSTFDEKQGSPWDEVVSKIKRK